jgi:hypothetical protein
MQLLVIKFTIKMFHIFVFIITNSCIWNIRVTWQGIDYKLPEDDKIVSKHVGVWYICETTVHLLVIVRNNKRCTVQRIKISWWRIFEHKKGGGRRAWIKLRSELFVQFLPIRTSKCMPYISYVSSDLKSVWEKKQCYSDM